MLRILLIGFVALAAVYGLASAVGAARWGARTRELRARLDAGRSAIEPGRVDFADIGTLPAPVQRYLRAVLEDGQPLVAAVRARHTGTFNMSESGENWRPFASEQWVVAQRPGFVWNARVAVAPGLPARVHDAYVAGEGILHAAMLGLASVADLRGGGPLAEGELMRFLAEATWYPTVFLPGRGVEWKAVDDRSALAALADGNVAVTLLFTFDDRGFVEEVRAEARGRSVGRRSVSTPWLGRFWNYERRGGMWVPIDAEVAWMLPEGERPYWRGRVTDLEYAFSS
jgi:hypothetical protein